MKTHLKLVGIVLALIFTLPVWADDPKPDEEKEAEKSEEKADSDEKKEDKKKEDKVKKISEVIKDHVRHDGLFPIYQDPKDGTVHLAIRQDQIGREYIYFTHTTDGITAVGHFRGAFKDNRVFSIRKHFNRIEFIAENTQFYFDENNALHRAAEANISPAVLAVQKVVAEEDETFLIKVDDIFLSEAFHQVKPSARSGSRSDETFTLGKLSKAKSKIAAVRNYPKNTDVVVEYVYESEAPTVRGGEDVTDSRNISIRMQHTLIEMPVNDYKPRFDDPRVGFFHQRITDMTSPSATPYRDLLKRWHLEKKDKSAPLSEPVEPIIWWIENTTPHEYRDTIRAAALAWNEAFEAAGFKNAIAIEVQPDDADWDAGDIRYNVLRWTSSPNPPFGGYGPSFMNPRTGQILGANIMLEYVFVSNRLRLERLFEIAALDLGEAADEHDHTHCSLGHHLHTSTLFGVHALKAASASDADITELVKASLYYLILHELGHTFGLSHNMRSSQLHSPTDIHNKELTGSIGLTGSVMDYPAVNLAPPGQEQGHYYTLKPGPYDLWAIEFGYSEALEDPVAEQQRLAAILARSTEPALAFGNDSDDMRSPGKAIDPRVMTRDMSNDAIGYAIGRFELVRETMDKLKSRFTIEGQSWHELRNAYLTLTSEYHGSASVISRYIGGVYVDRAKAGQPNAGIPFTPVSLEDQRRAMNALRIYLFAPDAFDAPEGIYNYLQMQRRGFDFSSEPEDPKLHDRVLNVQKNVLDHLLHRRVLQRITDSRLYGNEYTLAEFMIDLTNAIFADDARENVNTFRQNLQLEYARRLARIIDEKSDYDFLSKSMALHSLKSIESLLRNPVGANTETQAHRAHLAHVIGRALEVTR